MRSKLALGIVIIVLIVIAGAAAFYLTGPVAEQKMKGTVLTTVPINDWDFGAVGYEIYKGLAADYEGIMEWEFTEQVPISEMTSAVREKIAAGFNIIVVWGGEWVPTVLEVAPANPSIYFIEGGVMGPVEFPPNVNYLDTNLHEGDYLEGLIAGSLTKTNTIGIIAGEVYPKVTRMYEAFKAGAREVNPNVKFLFTALGSWIDPSGGRLAALSMIDAGADYLWTYSDLGDLGVLRAATERGVVGSPSWQDKYPLFPDAQVTSNVSTPVPGHKAIIETILNNTWTPGKEWDIGIGTGDQWMAEYRQFETMIPANIRTLVDQRFQGMVDGTFSAPVILEDTEF